MYTSTLQIPLSLDKSYNSNKEEIRITDESFNKKQNLNVKKNCASYKNLYTVDLTNFGMNNNLTNNKSSSFAPAQNFLYKQQGSQNNLYKNNNNFSTQNNTQKTKLNKNSKIFIPHQSKPYYSSSSSKFENKKDISPEIVSHISTNNNSPKEMTDSPQVIEEVLLSQINLNPDIYKHISLINESDRNENM